MDRDYDAFISHAGPDKLAIAVPVYEQLRARNINAFLDREELHVGDNGPRVMEYAMKTASVGVFILSPEFPARAWTMAELICFQQREQEAIATGQPLPKLIPVFYRLGVRDCRDRSIFYMKNERGESVFLENGFFDRVLRGRITMQQVLEAMKLLSLRTGIENPQDATNDDTPLMHERRAVIIDQIVEGVVAAVQKTRRRDAEEDKAIRYWRQMEPQQSATQTATAQSHAPIGSSCTDLFVPHFDIWQNPRYVSLLSEEGRPDHSSLSLEVRTKHHLLETKTEGALVVIQGMPGVGKTCAMRALCHDNEVRARFADGVYVVSLGADASPQTLVVGIMKAVRSSGGRLIAAETMKLGTVEAAFSAAMDWFKSRTCLFLLDDVWSTGPLGVQLLERFSRIIMSGKRSAMIVSTREKELLLHKSVTYKVRLSSHEPRGSSARQILLQCASENSGLALQDSSNAAFEPLLDMCGGLPVILAVTGRAIARMALDMGQNFDRAIQAYYIFRLESNESVIDRDADEYTSLSRALSTSLRILRQAESPASSSSGDSHSLYDEMHHSLCILQKQQWAPLTILRRIWNLSSVQEADAVAGKFSEVGLLDVHFQKCGDIDVKGVRLHDLVHEFALKQATAVGDVETSHLRLLDNFHLSYELREDNEVANSDDCRSWWTTTITIDNYLQENIIRHLLEGGNIREALVLVGRPQWIVRQLQTCGILLMERDFDILKHHIVSKGRGSTSQGDAFNDLNLLLNAVRMSVLAVLDNPREISFQLCARLITSRQSSKYIRNILEYAEKHSVKPSLRPISQCLRTADNFDGQIIQCRKPTCLVAIEEEGLLLAGTGDGRIQIFNVATGEMRKDWQADNRSISHLAVSKDKRLVVSSSGFETVKVFDMTNGSNELSVCRFPGSVWCFALTPDSKWLVAGCGNIVSLWDLESGRCVNPCVTWHKSVVTSVAVSSDGKLIAAGSLGGKVRVAEFSMEASPIDQDTESGWRFLSVLRRAYRYLTEKPNPDTSEVQSASDESNSGLNLASITAMVKHICFTEDSKNVLSSSHEVINLWKVGETDEEDTLLSSTGESYAVKVGRSAQIVAVFEGYHSICHLSTTANEAGQMAISVGSDGRAMIRLLDGPLVEEVQYAEKGEDIECALMTQGGEKMIWCQSEGIRIVNIANLSSMRSQSCSKHEGEVLSMCMTPDGTRFVTGGLDGDVIIWDARTGMQIGRALKGHRGYTNGVEVTADGQKIISMSQFGFVCAWDLHSQEQIAVFDAHTDRIEMMQVSLDGRYAITGSKDTTVRVWDLDACNGEHSVLDDHKSEIRKVYLPENEQQFLSLSHTEGILWDLETLKPAKVIEAEDICFFEDQAVEELFGVLLVRTNIRKCGLGDATIERDLYWKYLKWRSGSHEVVLATMDTKVYRMALCPWNRTLCVGLGSGHVSILKLELDAADEERAPGLPSAHRF